MYRCKRKEPADVGVFKMFEFAENMRFDLATDWICAVVVSKIYVPKRKLKERTILRWCECDARVRGKNK